MPTKKVASAYVDLQLSTAQFKAAIGEAESSMKKFAATTREETQKSREAVRLLNEDLGAGIPRGLQNIISKLPGVTTAMNLAFDAVVVFAMIDVIVKVTEKIVEFVNKSEEAAKKNAEAWSKTSEGLLKSNAEAQIANDKIDDSLAKLRGVPENRLKDALDESTLSSISLSEKLEKNITDMRNLLSLQGAKWYDKVAGQAGPDYVSKQLDKYEDSQRRISETAQEKRSTGVKTTDEVNQINLQERQALVAGTYQFYDSLKKAKGEMIELQDYYNTHHLPSGPPLFGTQKDWGLDTPGSKASNDKLNRIVGLSKIYGAGQQDKNIAAINSQLGLTGVVAAGQQIEVNTATSGISEKVASDAKAATEVQKKAADKWMKAQEDAFKVVNVPPSTLPKGAASLDRWESGAPQRETEFLKNTEPPSASQGGSEAMKLLNARMLDLTAVIKLDTRKQADRDYDKETSALTELGRTLDEADRKAAEVAVRLVAALDKNSEEVSRGAEQAATLLAKQGIFAVHAGVETGIITPHQAALQEAAIHVQEFDSKIRAANVVLTKLKEDQAKLPPGHTPEQQDNANKQLAVQNQIAGFKGDKDQQAAVDGLAYYTTGFKSQVEETFNDIIEKSENWGEQFKSTINGALTDVNNAILHILTTKPQAGEHPFAEAGKQIFGGIAKTGLQDAEGLLLHGVVGKLGTKANPMYTIDLSKAGSEEQATGQRMSGVNAGGLTGTFLNWANQSDFMGKLFGGRVFGPGGILDSGTNGDAATGSGTNSKLPNEATWPATMNSIFQIGASVAEGAAAARKKPVPQDDSSSGPGTAFSGDAPVLYQNGEPYGTMNNAGGGVLSAGDWSWVGEKGPELRHAGSTSRIYSNNDSMAMLGSHTTHNHSWNIDARGATDPAAIHMAVQRGIRQAAPHLVAATHSSQKDQGRRTPRGH